MLEWPRHEIQLKLNSSGYSGCDLNGILPQFAIDRKTIVGLTYYPCAEGPERFVLLVTIAALVGTVARVFIEEFARDLYVWMKASLLALFRKKNAPYGVLLVVFEDIELEFRCEFNDGDWLNVLKNLPQLIYATRQDVSKDWEIEKLDDGVFIVHPSVNEDDHIAARDDDDS